MIKEYGIKDWNSFIQTINGLTWSLARELGPSNIRLFDKNENIVH